MADPTNAAAPKDAAPWLAYAKLGQAADDAKAEQRYEIVSRSVTAASAAACASCCGSSTVCG